MATPTLKKETIQITLEKGSGTILVTRPDNTGKSIGLIHQFTYTGDATMDMMQALTAARRQLTSQMADAAKAAAAKPTGNAAKLASAEPAVADADDEQADADATEPVDATSAEPSEEDEATPEPGTDWKYDVDELADSEHYSRARIVTDDDPAGDLTAKLGKAALTNPDSDPASAPPEMETITDDQTEDDLTDVGDIQELLLF